MIELKITHTESQDCEFDGFEGTAGGALAEQPRRRGRAPVLIGAAAHFECRNEYRHYGDDHIIFIGHVERYAFTNKPTLLFCRGKYMRGEPLLPP